MTPEEVFDVWAPRDARWSPWAKPVLFAHLASQRIDPAAPPATPVLSYDVAALPRADGTTGVVVDLPGAEGVAVGVLLAAAGYRPVPLYNAVPASTTEFLAYGGVRTSVVDMAQVLLALREAAPPLAALRLPPGAPPAFLLDARRRTGDGAAALRPGVFDNRSVSLPTDFPSGNLLLSHGIRRAILVQRAPGQPQPDLAHTLRRWQDLGIEIQTWSPAQPDAPQPLVVTKPPWYQHLWHALRVRLRLTPSPLGGFGGVLPEPSSG
jgi:hypothetical protein